MPFIGHCDWEERYFKNYHPVGQIIPTGDPEAYLRYPKLSWIYNKMEICRIQNIQNAPLGVIPPNLPVFVKPIINLHGMSIGAKKVNNYEYFETHSDPGHFWMQNLDGEHLSTDIAVKYGQIEWMIHTKGMSNLDGTFDYWEVMPFENINLRKILKRYIGAIFKNYVGIVNVETIGQYIIEMHLRLSPQFIDLYPEGFLNSVVTLYRKSNWIDPGPVENGYSVPVFLNELPNEIKKVETSDSNVLSVQWPNDFSKQFNPKGGIRIAVINSKSLDSALDLKDQILEINYQNS